MSASKPLRIADHDPAWARRFAALGGGLRAQLGGDVLRIDHIGSTSVAGLAAKDVVDIQVTVGRLADADAWPEELLPGLERRPAITVDHVPSGGPDLAAEWEKRMWSVPQDVNLHVREDGRQNQRYALLFRDFLRTSPLAAGAYEAIKRALVLHAPDDWDAYYDVKDPACDLIWAGAQQWAQLVGWHPGPSDA